MLRVLWLPLLGGRCKVIRSWDRSRPPRALTPTGLGEVRPRKKIGDRSRPPRALTPTGLGEVRPRKKIVGSGNGFFPRPPLKKCCFRSSGRVSILLQNGSFFLNFGRKKNVGQNFIIFFLPPPPPKKKKKTTGKKRRFCGRPTGHNFSHLLDRKHIFFKGGPSTKLYQVLFSWPVIWLFLV